MNKYILWMMMSVFVVVSGCQQSGTDAPNSRKSTEQRNETELVATNDELNNPYWLQQKGERLLSQGQPEEALVWYEKSLSVDPHGEEALIGKMSALDQLGRTTETEALLEQQFKNGANPTFYKFWRAKATLHLRKGEPERALDAIDHAIEINWQSTGNFVVKGQVLDKLGKIEEARECFATADRFEPGTPYVYFAYLSFLMHANEPEEVLRIADQKLAFAGEDPVLFLFKGHALMQLGKKAEGKELVQKAIKLDPRLAESTNEKDE